MTETTSGAFDVSDYPSYFPPSIMAPPSMQGDAVITSSSSSYSSGNNMGAPSAAANIYGKSSDDHNYEPFATASAGGDPPSLATNIYPSE